MKLQTKKYTSLHRLLHWLMALAMMVLFVTGFLRMYWMGKKAVVDATASQQDLGATKEQALGIYKALREPMWQWHEIFAKVMIAAFVVRIIYMLVKGIRFPKPFAANSSVKEHFQGLTYVLFYLCVAVNAVTGIYLQWFDGSLREISESTHKLAVYWFPVFLFLHALGIVMGERDAQEKGFTSRMIGGD